MNTCEKCGKTFEGLYYVMSDYGIALNHENKRINIIVCPDCHHKTYWDMTLKDNMSVIYKGNCYYVDLVEGGYGGRKFNVTFNDGRKFKNVGLWFNGEVPKSLYKGDTGIIESL